MISREIHYRVNLSCVIVNRQLLSYSLVLLIRLYQCVQCEISELESVVMRTAMDSD